MRPLRSSSLKCSQVAQCGTRFELAIKTRGASACVRKTPTGLPDCTSNVSSLSRRRSTSTIRSKLSQFRAALPVAAVHDEIVGTLRNLGIEVVHQHAQRRFGEPALRRKRAARAARGSCGALQRPSFSRRLPSPARRLPRRCSRGSRRSDMRDDPAARRPRRRSLLSGRQPRLPIVSPSPSACAAQTVKPRSASSGVMRKTVQARFIASSGETSGEVPGLQSVAIAMGMASSRNRASGGSLRFAQEVRGAREQHGDRSGLGERGQSSSRTCSR